MNHTKDIAKAINITGTIQGVGFRPFIYRLARTHNILGQVKNKGSHLNIFAQGSEQNLASFINAIQNNPPALASIDSVLIKNTQPVVGLNNFTIRESTSGRYTRQNISDYGLCDNCLNEFHNPDNRRYQYPFISCCDCGPRYSILKDFPFDRSNTSYASFSMCEACRQEYHNPDNRRFHAQNISCPDCGPSITLSKKNSDLAYNFEAINLCGKLLSQGKIICIKSTGGYRLFCDAENKSSVARLRQLKSRPEKPFAVMFPDENNLQLLKDYLVVNPDSYTILTSQKRPIVTIAQQPDSKLAENINPGLNTIGAMLPASGLEYLLLKQIQKPLVATSANILGSNIITKKNLAKEKLAHIADAYLHHNLDIQQGLDDSVFKNSIPIRLGRGFSPYESKLPFNLEKPLLAFGAQNKNTITLAWEDNAITSQHLGNMENFDVWKNTLKQIKHLQQLTNIKANHYLVDAHPAYTSNQWVKNNRKNFTEILHHKAHASALAFEHKCLSPMLIFTWDGSGYGKNNILWGGEAFYGSPGQWQHMFSIKTFKLPGGVQAIKEPWRVAASLSWHAGLRYNHPTLPANNLKQLWTSRKSCPLTSSAGRLFDAAAAFLGLCNVSSYDGQAAMLVESVATDSTTDFIALDLNHNWYGTVEFDWIPLIHLLQNSALTQSYRAKVFHNSLAKILVDKTLRLANEKAFKHVGLTGGVFQNTLLREITTAQLKQQGFEVLLSNKIPANDAAISLGQVIEYGTRQQYE